MIPNAIKSAVDSSATAQRLVIASESPRTPWTIAGAVLVLSLAICPLWGWYKARETNRWWRAEISRSSAQVRAAVAAGSHEALASDEQIIKTLGATDAKLTEAEDRLKSAAQHSDVDCPVIPARCLRR